MKIYGVRRIKYRDGADMLEWLEDDRPELPEHTMRFMPDRDEYINWYDKEDVARSEYHRQAIEMTQKG